MPTYIYEVVPTKRGGTPRRYEIRHSIKEPALTRHPETGEPLRRVIAGAAAVIRGASPSGNGGGHQHTHSCGCGAGGC